MGSLGLIQSFRSVFSRRDLPGVAVGVERFEEGKNRMLDRAFYQLPFGVIGVLVNKIWEKDKLEELFNCPVKRL